MFHSKILSKSCLLHLSSFSEKTLLVEKTWGLWSIRLWMDKPCRLLVSQALKIWEQLVNRVLLHFKPLLNLPSLHHNFWLRFQNKKVSSNMFSWAQVKLSNSQMVRFISFSQRIKLECLAPPIHTWVPTNFKCKPQSIYLTMECSLHNNISRSNQAITSQSTSTSITPIHRSRMPRTTEQRDCKHLQTRIRSWVSRTDTRPTTLKDRAT